MSPKRVKRQYSEEALMSAIVDIATSKLSIRQASAKYGIPISTLGDRTSCRYAPIKLKPGKRSKLHSSQEERLVEYLLYRLSIGNGATRNEVRYIIKDVLNRDKPEGQEAGEGLFQGNLPSKVWVHRFMNRHPEIAARTSETQQRRKLTSTTVKAWFSNLKDFLLTKHEIVAERFLSSENSDRIFNIGEAGFPLSEDGMKSVTKDNKMISVLVGVSGDGIFINPLIVFPEGLTSEFDSSKYNVGSTPKGCMSSNVLFSWFTDSFFQSLKKKEIQFPILVFVDAQSTYIGLELVDLCRNNDIILFCFPPQCYFQPLEVSLFGPFRSLWNESFQAEKINAFFPLFDQAFEKAKLAPENLVAGFQKAGLIPFDSNAIDYSSMMDPTVTPKKKFASTSLSATSKFGAIVAFETFCKEISICNIQLFEKRFQDHYNIEDSSNLNQLWRAYKTLRTLTESTDDSNLNKSGESAQDNLESPETSSESVIEMLVE